MRSFMACISPGPLSLSRFYRAYLLCIFVATIPSLIAVEKSLHGCPNESAWAELQRASICKRMQG